VSELSLELNGVWELPRRLLVAGLLSAPFAWAAWELFARDHVALCALPILVCVSMVLFAFDQVRYCALPIAIAGFPAFAWGAVDAFLSGYLLAAAVGAVLSVACYRSIRAAINDEDAKWQAAQADKTS
jgi:hypothetical protein